MWLRFYMRVGEPVLPHFLIFHNFFELMSTTESQRLVISFLHSSCVVREDSCICSVPSCQHTLFSDPQTHLR